ncbi:MAG: AraC family transcriptional regulator, partial [Novosphingobium sp.]
KSRGYGASALLTRAAALILVDGLRDHPQCQTLFRDSNFRDPISRAVQLMEKHSHQEWTVAGFAAKVGLGRSTFAERFLTQVGKPPMEMLTEIRMQQAAKLLTETPLKVAEIGERVGYHSQSAFNRRFEDYFKITPAKMRARRRDSIELNGPAVPDFALSHPAQAAFRSGGYSGAINV